MLSDWELWAIATRLINDHGVDASYEASLYAEEMMNKGDFEGQLTWLLVVDRIETMQAAPKGPPN